MPPKKRPLLENKDLTIHRMVEDIVGCKWSLAILARVRDGVHRPGGIEHSIFGLSAKVLNQRLRKLTNFGLLERTSYAELPPRVEYQLTNFGGQLVHILDQIAALDPPIAPPVVGVRGKRGPYDSCAAAKAGSPKHGGKF